MDDFENNGMNQEEPHFEETKEETDKKCPQCGGIMNFDPKTGGMYCPFCEHKEKIGEGENERSADELDFDEAEETGNHDWGTKTKTVICKSCGGEMVYDELQISGVCPWCGSNQVMEEKGADSLAPNGVCPFKIDRQTAGANFKRWLKGKWFCPGKAKKMAKADAFTGVYLPYWTFDTDTYSEFTARYGIDREVEEEDSDGNRHTRTVTDWYRCSGSHAEFINDELVEATRKNNSDILSKIKPFNTEDNVVYRPEYLSGFASERYSVGIKDAWKIAKNSITSKLRSSIEKQIEYQHSADRVDSLKFSTDFSDITYKYLLLPVWMSSFKFKNKIYNFAVNGQTGKVGGKSPVSFWRVLLAVLIAAGIIALIVYLANR